MRGVALIEQLVASMEEAVKKLEKAIEKNKKEEANRLKILIIELYNKIKEATKNV